MICSRKVLSDYCSTLFPILDEVVSVVGALPHVPNARYQPNRYPGYLAERFLAFYLHAMRMRVIYADMVEVEVNVI